MEPFVVSDPSGNWDGEQVDLKQDLEKIDPEDVGALVRLLEEHGEEAADEGNETDPKGDTDDGKPSPGQGKDEPKAEGATPGAKDEPEPQGISSKDGKHVLPYGVLQGERRARQQAEQRAQQLQEELDRVKAEGGKPSKETAAAIADADISDEELAQLEADMPAVAKIAKANRQLVSEIRELKGGKATPATKQEPTGDDDAADEAAVNAATIQAELAEHAPLLAKWGEKGNALWKEACTVDAELSETSAWKDKPRTERFAEVQRVMAERYDLPIPSPKKPEKATKTTTVEEPPARGPSTLSDIGGRAPVAEADEIAGLTPLELRSKFNGMSDDQISRYLARASAAH